MIKISFLILTIIFFSGCISKRGISTKYYNDCNEYYDYQGYYHKKCDDGGMLTFDSIKDGIKSGKKKPEGNVW